MAQRHVYRHGFKSFVRTTRSVCLNKSETKEINMINTKCKCGCKKSKCVSCKVKCKPCSPTTSVNSGVMKFTGNLRNTQAPAPAASYLADTGIGLVVPLTSQQRYPVGGATKFKNLTVNLQGALLLGESATFNVLKNGVATGLTLTYTGLSAGGVQTVVADVSYASGDTFDLQAILVSTAQTEINASATIGF